MSDDSSPGELELDVLIRSMQPVLYDDNYVFVTVDHEFNNLDLSPLMFFREQEGTTLIVTQKKAQGANLQYEFPCKLITLNIHSSLDAVGFLARITQRLASLRMGVNPVSGFFHDHLFVPIDRAEDAMHELKVMSSELTA